MRLDLKIQDKSLKEAKRVSSLVSGNTNFILVKITFSQFLQRHCPCFLESVLILQFLHRGILNPRHIKN